MSHTGYNKPLKLQTAPPSLSGCLGHRDHAKLEEALRRILRGMRSRSRFGGMNYKDIERICAKALGEERE